MPPKITKKAVEAQKKQAVPQDVQKKQAVPVVVQKKQAGLLLFILCWTMTYNVLNLKKGYLFNVCVSFLYLFSILVKSWCLDFFIMLKLRYSWKEIIINWTIWSNVSWLTEALITGFFGWRTFQRWGASKIFQRNSELWGRTS